MSTAATSALTDDAANRGGVVAVGYQVFNAFRKLMLRAAVQNGNGMTGFQQLGDELPADKQCSSDDQDFHEAGAKTVSRNIRGRDA